MTDNISRQVEEVEALSSIYGDDWIIDGTSSYSIQIKEGPHSVILYIELPEGYPSDSPPVYQLLAPELSTEIKRKIALCLDDVYLQNIGETVLYQWVETVREVLQQQAVSPEEPPNSEENADLEEETYTDTYVEPVHVDPPESGELPDIHHGDVITDRKSVFQGHAAHVVTPDQVKAVVHKLYENKKIAHATHNIYAYRIFKEDTNTYIQDCEDDGEQQAGGRLLHLLQILDTKNVLVVVSRWYGGILLGPDRFRHINNAARQVLDSAGFIPSSHQQQQQQNSKKKK